MAKKYETTVKELAFKAFCDGAKGIDTRYYKFDKKELSELKDRFELWWSENYYNRFESQLGVFIDLKRYIRVE